MDAWKNPNQDERGVDVGQIRNQLRMTVEERVVHMVAVANTFMRIRKSVKIVERPIHR